MSTAETPTTRQAGTGPFALALLLGSLAAGCDRTPGEADPAPSATVYPVLGVVQKRMDDPAMLLIDHREIPGFMPRMIMPFRARDAAEFADLEPGMEVTLDFHVTETDSWATNVIATGETGPITLDEENDNRKLLGVGDPLPDHEFLDENGSLVRLSDYHGMPVAITFVFSRCPVPEYCPRMMNHFAGLVAKLEADPEAPETYHLLTISFDTENDSPELMKTWAAAYGHRPDQPWSLLTTPHAEVIDSIGAQVGLRFGEVNGTLQHNLRTIVLDRKGTIRTLYTDETWAIDDLVAALKGADT